MTSNYRCLSAVVTSELSILVIVMSRAVGSPLLSRFSFRFMVEYHTHHSGQAPPTAQHHLEQHSDN
jgi:hypothetical protein